MMTPSRILDAQTDFTFRLGDAEFSKTLSVPVLAASRSKANELEGATDEARNHVAREAAAAFMTGLTGAVHTAYAYRVTEDMVDLIVHAADSLDESDEWNQDLAPTGAGFLHFEKPLPVGRFIGVDKAEHSVGADWLIWGPGKSGTMMFFLGDPRRPGGDPWTDILMKDDDITEEQAAQLRHVMGNWVLIGWSSYSRGRSLGPQELEVDQNRDPDWESPGSSLAAASIAGITAEGLHNAADIWVARKNDARLVHALWLLMNQTIVVTEEEDLERPSRRRAEKARLPGRVTTITLRRRKYEHKGEGSHVEWQHRWIVRGHWAWRRCGSDLVGAEPYDKGYRRRIWINPYEKGPEDKPLVLTEKLIDLRR